MSVHKRRSSYELHNRRREYDREVISLRVAFRKEQEDVEKLEGRSLSNYFFQVVGKLDEKLDQERQGAYAAKVKLDVAERELAGIESDIAGIQSQLSEIRKSIRSPVSTMISGSVWVSRSISLQFPSPNSALRRSDT